MVSPVKKNILVAIFLVILPETSFQILTFSVFHYRLEHYFGKPTAYVLLTTSFIGGWLLLANTLKGARGSPYILSSFFIALALTAIVYSGVTLFFMYLLRNGIGF